MIRQELAEIVARQHTKQRNVQTNDEEAEQGGGGLDAGSERPAHHGRQHVDVSLRDRDRNDGAHPNVEERADERGAVDNGGNLDVGLLGV